MDCLHLNGLTMRKPREGFYEESGFPRNESNKVGKACGEAVSVFHPFLHFEDENALSP